MGGILTLSMIRGLTEQVPVNQWEKLTKEKKVAATFG